MPSWNELVNEVESLGDVFDRTRLKYLEHLYSNTGRNIIVYYSGWLHKYEPALISEYSVNDSDKNAFMATIHQLDKKKGLDLFLHTPGGGIAATESLVDSLHGIFGRDIRVIVPQIAMSAGTMIALASDEILMGKHSNLGPIDPQVGPFPARAIVEEFDAAKADIKNDPSTIPVWQPIIARYSPTLIGQAKKAIAWSESMVKKWLAEGMLRNEADPDAAAQNIINELAQPAVSPLHERHISMQQAQDIGLKVTPLEDDQKLQEDILTVHHACMLTLAQTSISKLVENHQGVAYVSRIRRLSRSSVE